MDINKIIDRLGHIKEKKILVLGDYCLDKYVYSDPAEDDVSLETGVAAWQIYGKKMAAGAAGTITNNLRALGAEVICVGIVGDDGEGYDLLKCLKQIGADTRYIMVSEEITTATYLKNMRKQSDGRYREDTRLDFRNRSITSEAMFEELGRNFEEAVKEADGIIVSDQFFERNSGVVGDILRTKINEFAKKYKKPFLVDSRAFAREYKGMFIKCNNYELMKYCGAEGDPECMEDVLRGGMKMKQEVEHSIFITCNKDGIKVFEDEISHVPTYPVEGEIDVTGAGDASNAGIALSLALGLTPTEAAMVACCVSSITIQQLGTTGTATVEGVIERLKTINKLMTEKGE